MWCNPVASFCHGVAIRLRAEISDELGATDAECLLPHIAVNEARRCGAGAFQARLFAAADGWSWNPTLRCASSASVMLICMTLTGRQGR